MPNLVDEDYIGDYHRLQEERAYMLERHRKQLWGRIGLIVMFAMLASVIGVIMFGFMWGFKVAAEMLIGNGIGITVLGGIIMLSVIAYRIWRYVDDGTVYEKEDDTYGDE